MVLYTEIEMTATHSNTVAANKRRSFLRKLIAVLPGAVNQFGHRPTICQAARARPRPILPGDPVPSRARVHLRHSQPANEKEGLRRDHRVTRARPDTDPPGSDPSRKGGAASPAAARLRRARWRDRDSATRRGRGEGLPLPIRLLAR